MKQLSKPGKSAYRTYSGGKRDEHRVVYEQHCGPIPLGYDVHHKDGNTWNNDSSNLEALSKRDHIRLHKGWKLIDEVWRKPCTRCLELKPLTEFHRNDHGRWKAWKNHCKPCAAIEDRDRYFQKKECLAETETKLGDVKRRPAA